MWSQLIACLVAFTTTYLTTPYAIRYFKKTGVVTRDVHKPRKPFVANSAGVPLVAGITAGLFTYIFIQVFLYQNYKLITEVFAGLTSILLIAFSGFLDDINASQVRVGKYIEGKAGLKRWQKPLLTLPAAVPLMVIMAGNHTMALPLIGTVDFGILYPLVIIPIGVVGAANMVNMFDGFNGLDTGMGLVYTLSLGLFAYFHGRYVAAIIFLSTFAALLGLYRYNFYPAKILSGDSCTYALGAVIAVGAILGNMEKAALTASVPFLVQGALKFYSYFKLGRFASDLGVLQKDGTLKPKYKRIYSWTHLFMRIGKTERKVVLLGVLTEAIFAVLAWFV